MTDNASASPLGDRERGRAFAVCVAVAAVTVLDLTKVNVGLPSIERALGADSTQLQLLVGGYSLAFGLVLVPAGRLGDLYSRRTMFVIGLSLFIGSSLLCAVAPNIELLLVFRTLQGVAAGIQIPQVLGLIQQLYHGEQRGRAFGLFGATIGICTAVGPTFGGVLVGAGGEPAGWPLLFWINVPLGALALVFAIRTLPTEHQRHQDARDLDVVGILLLGVGVLSLMLPFLLTTGGPSDDPRRWLTLPAFVAVGALFVRWERRYQQRGKSPVVHLDLFRQGAYRNGVLVITAYFAALPALFLLTTLFLQQGLGVAPVYAGMVGIPFAVGSAAASWLGGRLVGRYGRNLVVAGIVCVIVGVALVACAATLPSADASPWWIAAAMLVAGVGGGFVVSPNQTLTLAEVPVDEGGVAGSVMQVGQRVGTAIGVAAASSAFFATLYAEQGPIASVASYRDGFRNGAIVSAGLVVVALVFAVLDLRGRTHRRERTLR